MLLSHRILASLVLFSFANLAAAGDSLRGNKEAIAAFERLLEAYDLHGDSAPFELRAEIRVGHPTDAIEGHLTLLWAAPDHWREEINLGGFRQVRTIDGDRQQVQRNLGFVPGIVSRVARALHVDLLHFDRRGGRLGKLRQQQVPGGEARCGKVNWQRQSGNTTTFNNLDFCFDPPTGDLVSLSNGHTKLDFQRPLEFGAKRIPSAIRHLEGDGREIELKLALKPQPEASQRIGVLGEEAETWPWCPDMVPARLRDTLDWQKVLYPTSLVVDEKGGASRIIVAGVESEAAAEEYRGQLAEVSFVPARCDGKAVKAELHLSPTPITVEHQVVITNQVTIN